MEMGPHKDKEKPPSRVRIEPFYSLMFICHDITSLAPTAFSCLALQLYEKSKGDLPVGSIPTVVRVSLSYLHVIVSQVRCDPRNPKKVAFLFVQLLKKGSWISFV